MKNPSSLCNVFSVSQCILIIFGVYAVNLPNSLADSSTDRRNYLANKLELLSKSPTSGHYPIALAFETQYIDGQGVADLYLLSNIPFPVFVNFFDRGAWCNALILQIHIKACKQYNKQKLEIYLGTEDYDEPIDVFKFDYKITKQRLEADYLRLDMMAEDGPIDSKNYHIGLEIIPNIESKSLVHFQFQAYYGFFSRAAIGTYLLTAGRSKVGFTILGKDSSNLPIYQRGMKGILERNAMRYVLAFFAYLEINPNGNSDSWLEKSLQRWHRYSDQFHQQLYEMPLKDYINLKNAEYRNQLKLSHFPSSSSSNEQWPDD